MQSFDVEDGGAVQLERRSDHGIEQPRRDSVKSFSGAGTSFVGSAAGPLMAEQEALDAAHSTTPRPVIFAALGAWCVFLAFALVMNFGRSWPLAFFSAVTVAFRTGAPQEFIAKVEPSIARMRLGRIIVGIGGVIAVIVCIIQIVDDFVRFQPFVGLCVFIVACAASSSSLRDIDWMLIAKGLLIQFFIGLLVLRSDAGFHAVDSLGTMTANFLASSDEGAAFVFGSGLVQMQNGGATPAFLLHFFALKLMPTVIFFSAFTSCMYYIGVLQAMIYGLTYLLRVSMGTGPVESVNAAGSIFLGLTEAPLLIKPFIASATESEVHAVMTSGFATIAGSVMAAYIGMGIDPSQIICSSVMSAPGALMVSKLLMPEVGRGGEGAEYVAIDMPPPIERNIIEAAGNGASAAIGLVSNILAMLIAFLSLMLVLNNALGYLGGLVGYPEVTFQILCSYAFAPVAWLIGAPADDVRCVGQLIGTKTFVNEFVAYGALGQVMRNQTSTGDICYNLSRRGQQAATYALCGFANVGSLGITLGGLKTLAPERSDVFARLVLRAMIAGTIVSFNNACIAGILT